MTTQKDTYNFAVVAKHDPALSQLIFTSPICEVYKFDNDKSDWDKIDCKGTFFLYSRVSKDGFPYAILVLNRNNTLDFSIGITPHALSRLLNQPAMEVDSQGSLIMIHSDPSSVYGLWLFSEQDRPVVLELVNWCLTKGSTQ